MFDERSEQVQRVVTLLDVGVTIFAFLVAPALRIAFLDDDFTDFDFWSHASFLPFILSLWIFSLTFFGAYRSPRMTSRLKYTWAVVRSVATGLGSLLTIFFVLKIQYMSRVAVVIFAVLDVLILVAIRFGI